jgi:hypothetical protein
MPLKRGLWLTLIDDAGESYPVACDVTDRRTDLWILETMIPPQVYPVCFVAARLRLDGNFLGMLRFPEPFETVTHQPRDVRIEFPIDARRLEGTSFAPAPAGR